ncbi:hypothetical protein PHYBOEH_008213 [Phytophthora boehmeriae]|uniref:DUF8003 domain-containing protein n=1 Tax=Phytophthora boehmeriae TaxID=109152 RepID=A0A8T1X1G5_9STRA|nr:hypothetical protein PHYBOEH_008213 [Phytophthora boehmeriae]
MPSWALGCMECGPWRLKAAALCQLLLVAATLVSIAHARPVEVEGETLQQAELQPHCVDFLQYCTWNTSTSSCEFRTSTTFVCGPRAVSQGLGSAATEPLNGSTVTPSFDSVGATSVAGLTCQWDVAGDLRVAPDVEVAVEGDDCLVHIGAGQMVLLGAKSSLKASSLSIEAAFVHLEEQAQISASYSGAFRGGLGLYTGTDVFGASHGGGGGQRLIANMTMLTEQTTRGFFDVRGRTVDPTRVQNKEELLRDSSEGWQLATLWRKEKTLLADPVVMAALSGASEDPSAMIAPFLLGSGSRVISGTGQALSVDGGGRIQIKASKDVVLMDGACVRANGGSAIDGLSGGSGGSVFISSSALLVAGSVQAKGGDAYCADTAGDRGITHCFPAGGGGRVQITYVSSQLDPDAIDATGGSLAASRFKELLTKSDRFHRVQVTALAGAAGTYYQVVEHSDGAHEAQLFVDNNMQRLWPNGERNNKNGGLIGAGDLDEIIGGAVTSLYVRDDELGSIGLLTIADGAVVASSGLLFAQGDLKVLNGSYLLDSLLVGMPQQLPDTIKAHTGNKPPILRIRVRDMVVSTDSQMILPTSALQLSARSLSMDATAALDFTWSVQIITSQNIHLDANISCVLTPIIASTAVNTTTTTSTASTSMSTELFGSKMMALISGGDVFLGGVIAVGALSVSSEFSITVEGELEALNAPSIKSTFRSCKEQQWLSLHSRIDNVKKMDHGDPDAGATVPSIPSALPKVNNYTIVLHARGSIYIGESTETKNRLEGELEDGEELPSLPIGHVSGGAVLLCATDAVEISVGSIVSSDGKGELANQGPGMGSCAASIGGGAGYGGRGADSSVVTHTGDYAAGGLPYGTRSGTGMLGSGGGCVDGGNGGGIVMLGASGLILNGQIHCNGDGGANGAGGGSGGFLGLSVAQYLRGHGHISAVGGGSECTDAVLSSFASKTNWLLPFFADDIQNEAADEHAEAQTPMSSKVVPRLCGGGGGGGRLQLTGCELSTFDKCTRDFDGNYTVAGGATSYKLPDGDGNTEVVPASIPAPTVPQKSIVPAGASGSFFGFPCPPGSGGLFCRLCPVGKYKSESNSAVCVPCTNAPSNAHYVGLGSTSSRCDWACDPGYSGYYCVSPIQQLLDACGGELGFALVLMSICPELTAFIDEPWIEFVAELNELLRVVQRDETSLVESLIPVAAYLEKQQSLSASANRLGGLRIYLGRFYVQDELDMGEEFKLGLFLTTANESLDNANSGNNRQQQQQQKQGPPSSTRYGYPKDYNINDVYGYGRGDSLDYPARLRSNGSYGNADGMLYDMGGWGTALHPNSNGLPRTESRGSNNGNATQNPVSSIREEALRIRSSSIQGDGNGQNSGRGGNPDDVLVLVGSGPGKTKRHNSSAHHTFYEGWLGPVDASLPVPGVLICAAELRERLADRAPRQMLKSFLRFHLMPRNVPRSTSLNLSWMLSISLLSLLMVDLAITCAILVNLKCVTDGEVDHDCSASIMVPVLLVPPLALIVSPIMGIVSLALSSSTFTRRFSVWNALSMVSVGIAILACIAQSSRLVAPWFAGPLPLLPVIGMGVKAGQAYLVERYIAFQETQRRRRGWRGIMKRRLSDASIPTESPYSSPATTRANDFRLNSTPMSREDQGQTFTTSYGAY